jgi:hypothetical protein
MGMMKRLANVVPNRNKNRSLAMSQWSNNRHNYEGMQEGLSPSSRNYSGVIINPPTPPDQHGNAPRYNYKHFMDPTLPPAPPK